MATSAAYSDHIYLGHFDVILSTLSVADLGLKWQKSSLDKSRYQLVSPSSAQSYAAWNSGSSWGTLGGSTASTLKEGKELEEMRLKANIMEELADLERYLRAYDVHRKAIFAVKGEQFDDDKRISLSSFALRALNVILSRLMSTRIRSALLSFPSIAACETSAVLAMAIAGFDLGDLKLMFVEPRITFTTTKDPVKRYSLNGKSIEMPVNTLVNSSEVMQEHPGFRNYRGLHITRLDEKQLIRQLDTFIERTFHVAKAVRD